MGSVSGSLALWSVGREEGERGGGEKATPPTVSQQAELDLEAGVFSLSFDQDMKLVGRS